MGRLITSNSAEIAAEFRKIAEAEFRKGNAAALSIMRQASTETKQDWRAQIAGAGLGNRLANTVRSNAYQNEAKPSVGAWSLVWSKSPKITAAHEAGPLIVPLYGRWLAIPTEAAGKGQSGKKLTPGEWQFSRGRKLRFVPISATRAFLVADDVRVGARGSFPRRYGRVRVRPQYAQTPVPIFILVRQAKLRKKYDLMAAADRIAATLPGRLAAAWRD